MDISITTTIILAVILLHLVVGFGYLIYKLSPKEGDKTLEELDEEMNND